MRHPRDFLFIRRLNAPTRAAAARRRRLRKVMAATLTALAILIALPSTRSTGPTASNDPARLRGRQVVSLPADPGLVTGLTPSTRVSVWDTRGRPLVRDAPILLPESRPGLGAAAGKSSSVLVAVNARDLEKLGRNGPKILGDAPNMTVTISP